VGQWSKPLRRTHPGGYRFRAKGGICEFVESSVVFDLATHRVITALKDGGGTEFVALDPALTALLRRKGRKFTVIQQVGPDDSVRDEIRTHYGANTLTSTRSHIKVFIAYASLLAHPGCVFSPKP